LIWRSQKIHLDEIHAAMAQDVVGRRDVMVTIAILSAWREVRNERLSAELTA
jgi:hypothetical protein